MVIWLYRLMNPDFIDRSAHASGKSNLLNIPNWAHRNQGASVTQKLSEYSEDPFRPY